MYFSRFSRFPVVFSSLVAVAGQGSWGAEAALLCDGDGSPSARSASGRCGLGGGVGGGYFLPITCAIVNRTPPSRPRLPGCPREGFKHQEGLFPRGFVAHHRFDRLQ